MLSASCCGEAKTAENGAFYTTLAALHTTGMSPILSSLRAFSTALTVPATPAPTSCRPWAELSKNKPRTQSERSVVVVDVVLVVFVVVADADHSNHGHGHVCDQDRLQLSRDPDRAYGPLKAYSLSLAARRKPNADPSLPPPVATNFCR